MTASGVEPQGRFKNVRLPSVKKIGAETVDSSDGSAGSTILLSAEETESDTLGESEALDAPELEESLEDLEGM